MPGDLRDSRAISELYNLNTILFHKSSIFYDLFASQPVNLEGIRKMRKWSKDTDATNSQLVNCISRTNSALITVFLFFFINDPSDFQMGKRIGSAGVAAENCLGTIAGIQERWLGGGTELCKGMTRS